MKKNIKKCLIVCWYGTLPKYFEVWLKSCSYNKDYDFLIFTDQVVSSKYNNVKVIVKTLDEMNKLFSQKLNLNIKIKKAYKFCDFRPAFGIIFADYLKNYDFWGHCDFDQIFGKINNFITNDMLKKYEIINKNGHFKLYKNTPKINNLFLKNDAKFNYKEVFLSNYNYAFDEFSGINLIIEKNKIATIYINDFSDINVKHKRYICANSNNYKNQIYVYNDGILFKYFYKKNILQREEKMYLHFQKKSPSIFINNSSNFVIGKNGFFALDSDEINLELMKKINPYNSKFIEYIEILKYFYAKTKKFLLCSNDEKIIWIKQKLR